MVLPLIAIREVEEGRHRQQAGPANAVLQELELRESPLHIGIWRHHEAGLTGQQNALGADRKFEPEPDLVCRVGGWQQMIESAQ